MTDNFLSNLNPQQKEAVKNTEGLTIILAGAGSGKTRVLTYRVCYLMEKKGVDPSSILMVTFTNKAAREMESRIEKLLGGKKNGFPVCGTFHRLGAKILRVHGNSTGIDPGFVIYDEADQKEAVKEAMAISLTDTKKYSPNAFLSYISQAKNELISDKDYKEYAYTFFQKEVAKVYPIYQKILSKNNALDFDDLISETVRLLKANKDVRNYYQSKFRYLLIDEYQDTNRAQYILSKLLAKKHGNICVVGDASQSIYAWRGADYRNIENLKKDFPQSKVFHLERNYRSTKAILDASYGVISNNREHPVLKLWTEKRGGQKVQVKETASEESEAMIISEKISSDVSAAVSKYSDFAVLYRTNAQSRKIEEVFLHLSIPYMLIGGVKFYERKEIKDITAMLRLIQNPRDVISEKRILKVGKKIFKSYSSAAEKLDRKNKTSLDILDHILQFSTYLESFDRNDPSDAARLENIREMRSVASEFPNLENFLENISLVEQEKLPDTPSDKSIRPDAVTLMTIHSSKGLEFPHVYIIGMEEGLFPHSKTLMDRFEIEEERRLCYVGMTRAMDTLTLTYARKRLYFGTRNSNPVSRFITEIPKDLIEITRNYPF